MDYSHLTNMNEINTIQNNRKQIELLFTQRSLYSGAKKYFIWRTVFALILAIVGPIISFSNESVGLYVGIVSIAYLLISHLVLERLEGTKKINAAKIQEEFDTSVLSLLWNEVVAGSRPDMEIVASVLSQDRAIDSSSLENWYASDVSKVPLELGRLLCQRANTWWDSTLRNRYIALLLVLLFGTISILIILGIQLDLTLSKFILGVLLPIVPLIELLLKQIRDHFESHACILELKGKLDNSIEILFQGKGIHNPEAVARVFQDEIFRHRKKCPMVFDWVYWFFRDRQENQMQFSIKGKVEAYLSTRKSS